MAQRCAALLVATPYTKGVRDATPRLNRPPLNASRRTSRVRIVRSAEQYRAQAARAAVAVDVAQAAVDLAIERAAFNVPPAPRVVARAHYVNGVVQPHAGGSSFYSSAKYDGLAGLHNDLTNY